MTATHFENVTEYRIGTDGRKAIRKKQLLYSIPLMLVAISVAPLIGTLNAKSKGVDVSILPFYLPLIFVILGWSLYRGIKQRSRLLESYALTITTHAIGREQLNTSTIALQHTDVREIIRYRNGSFVIKGKEKADVIYVPSQIDNYDHLEKALNGIKPVTQKAKAPLAQRYPAVVSLLTMGLVLCVYLSTNRLLVGVSGTLLTAGMVWTLIKTRQSKNIDRRTKQRIWIVAIVIVSILYMMYTKLTATAI